MATPDLWVTNELCHYGCGQVARWRFKQGKLCCSKSYNSCPEKRRKFSEEVDHKTYSAKSLATRKIQGITKTSQIKASKTRIESGHYERLSIRMREVWANKPWNNQCRSGFTHYKDTSIPYQGSYELGFLSKLEEKNGLEWIIQNVKRGPATYFSDPISGMRKLYLPDFQIGNVVYEIKSSYTWNQNNTNQNLELLNRAKLESVKEQGFKVVLVLDHKEQEI